MLVWIFLVLDSLAFAVLFHEAIDAFLLACDGVRGWGSGAALTGLCLAGLWGLSAGYRKVSGERAKGRVPSDILFVVFVLGFLALITAVATKKNQSFLWLAMEWHKVPENILLLLRLSPVVSGALLAAGLLLTPLQALRPGRWLLGSTVVGFLAYVFWTVDRIQPGGRGVVYLGVYATPLALALVGLWTGRRRLFSRGFLLSTLVLVILSHYVGDFPLAPPGARERLAGSLGSIGIDRVYPRPGEKSPIPLAFLRRFVVDIPRGYLFTAYGPTSGLVRLDLRTAELRTIPTEVGMVRHLASRDDLDIVYAIDWVKADVLEIRKDPFEITQRVDLYGDWFVVPFSFVFEGGKLYVASTEEPGLREWDIGTWTRGRGISFREEGLTKYRSGVWEMILGPDPTKLFVEIGMVDLEDRFALLRIDRDSLAVDGVASLPEGGLEVFAIPRHASVVVTSFFSNRFYEIDAATMDLKRVIPAAMNSRAAVYDARRDLIYALSFLPGELVALRYSDGAIVRKEWIGTRAMSIALSESTDELYVGSSEGIFRVRLAEFAGPPPGVEVSGPR